MEIIRVVVSMSGSYVACQQNDTKHVVISQSVEVYGKLTAAGRSVTSNLCSSGSVINVRMDGSLLNNGVHVRNAI